MHPQILGEESHVMDDWPDPRTASNQAEFVAAMRLLRTRTDMSYRVLERRAARAGASLPSSTISGALSRDTLPRADLVAAFVRACGGDDATVERWLASRADLAAQDIAPTQEVDRAPEQPDEADPVAHPDPAHPANGLITHEPETPARRRWLMPTAVAAATAVAVLIAGLIVLTGAEDNSTDGEAADQTSTPLVPPAAAIGISTSRAPTPSTAPPADASVTPTPGPQRVRLAHTGLCVGEGKEKFKETGRDVLGQYDCATAAPKIAIEPVATGYRLLLNHPEKGTGCATVDGDGAFTESLIAGASCEDDRPDQLFTFERVHAPVAGFRMHSVSGPQWCIGVYQALPQAGVQLMQGPCDGGAHQVFLLNTAQGS
jgi:hypothetical protein